MKSLFSKSKIENQNMYPYIHSPREYLTTPNQFFLQLLIIATEKEIKYKKIL